MVNMASEIRFGMERIKLSMVSNRCIATFNIASTKTQEQAKRKCEIFHMECIIELAKGF